MRLDAVTAAIAQGAEEADVQDGELSREIELLRSEGWLVACLPSGHGGSGWGTEPEGTLPAFDALRALGRANLSVARLFEGHMNAVKLLCLYASDGLREAAFADVTKGELLAVWGADDPAAPFGFMQHDKQLHLTGAKQFASGLGLVGQAVITAQADEGVQLMLLPVKDPIRTGYSAWAMDGMRATKSGHYNFNGESTPEERCIGKPGDYLGEPFFEGGIWRYCAAHLGAAEALFTLLRDALIARERADDPHQQRRIVEGAIAIETVRLWLLRAAEAVEAVRAKPEAATISLLAREVTESCCRKVLETVDQALGMGAHEAGSAVERMARDLRLFLCQAAPDAKRTRAAKALIARGKRVEFV